MSAKTKKITLEKYSLGYTVSGKSELKLLLFHGLQMSFLLFYQGSANFVKGAFNFHRAMSVFWSIYGN